MSNRRALRTLVAIACVPALAGCGFSGNSSISNSSGGSPDAALAFADCMRSHGAPQFPDPGETPGGGVRQRSVIASSPAFRSALAKCNKLVPGGGPKASGVVVSASDLRSALSWARCVRRHGYPNFPDPSTTARAGLSFRGIVFPVGSGFNIQAPAFKRAQAACGFGPGGGKGPPGATS